jgi:hypothetical protein
VNCTVATRSAALSLATLAAETRLGGSSLSIFTISEEKKQKKQELTVFILW